MKVEGTKLEFSSVEYMQHPLINKKDFEQALTELGWTTKQWIEKQEISYEWLRRILSGEAQSHRIETAIIETVEKGEYLRTERHKQRKQQFIHYEEQRKKQYVV